MHNSKLINKKVSLKYLMRGIWRHISKRRKIQLGLLSILMICSGIAEMFSLAAVVPFLSVLNSPEYVWNLKLLTSS